MRDCSVYEGYDYVLRRTCATRAVFLEKEQRFPRLFLRFPSLPSVCAEKYFTDEDRQVGVSCGITGGQARFDRVKR